MLLILIIYNWVEITTNSLGYEKLGCLTLNCASNHLTENPGVFSEIIENKQLLVTILSGIFYYRLNTGKRT